MTPISSPELPSGRRASLCPHPRTLAAGSPRRAGCPATRLPASRDPCLWLVDRAGFFPEPEKQRGSARGFVLVSLRMSPRSADELSREPEEPTRHWRVHRPLTGRRSRAWARLLSGSVQEARLPRAHGGGEAGWKAQAPCPTAARCPPAPAPSRALPARRAPTPTRPREGARACPRTASESVTPGGGGLPPGGGRGGRSLREAGAGGGPLREEGMGSRRDRASAGSRRVLP